MARCPVMDGVDETTPPEFFSMPSFGVDAVLVLVLTATLLVALATDKLPPAAIGLGLILALPALGVLRFEEAVAGFSNKAVLTLAALFVIGEALTRTGAVAFVGRMILARAGESPTRILLLLTSSAAFVSAFLNDTAVVAVFLPIVLDLSRRTTIPASHLMMPLAFASLLGGMCTLVGTSTNLIVSGVAEELGAEPLTLLSLAPVGVPMAVLCVLLIVWLAPRMLPRHDVLKPHVPAAHGAPEERSARPDGAPASTTLFEVAVSPRSPMIEARVSELELPAGFGVDVLAILRDGHALLDRVADVRLQGGDMLLLSGDQVARKRLSESGDFYLLADPETDARLRKKARLALWVTALVMAGLLVQSQLAFTGFPPAAIALTGAMLVVTLGCLPVRAAYRSVDWSILLFIAGTLALGKAIERTGIAAWAADQTVELLLPLGAGAVASGIVLLCILFNFLVSHAAVAALFAPVAVAAARQIAAVQGLDPASSAAFDLTRMMLLAVCFGGSICFATPVAHQVNLMVMAPGGYHFRDFLRFGGVVALVAWVIVSLLLPYTM